MRYAFLLIIIAFLKAYATDDVVFEDERFKSEISPLINDCFNNLTDTIHLVENNEGIAVVSIVSTPTTFKDGRQKKMHDMLKITLVKGMAAISKFIESAISTESEIHITSKEVAVQGSGQDPYKSKETSRKMNEKMSEKSSMVMVSSKAYAYWFTDDKKFLKRAVILTL